MFGSFRASSKEQNEKAAPDRVAFFVLYIKLSKSERVNVACAATFYSEWNEGDGRKRGMGRGLTADS
jgi:hypothetical protein